MTGWCCNDANPVIASAAWQSNPSTTILQRLYPNKEKHLQSKFNIGRDCQTQTAPKEQPPRKLSGKWTDAKRRPQRHTL